MSLDTALMIHEDIVSFHLFHALSSGPFRLEEWGIVPSMNCNLFLAERAMVIDLLQVL
jgi:hypothetical protein